MTLWVLVQLFASPIGTRAMTETTEKTGESSATAIDDTRPVDNVPPFVIPRDRRKYTRFLAPPFDGPGLQLFEGPEHEALGDGLTFYHSDGSAFTQLPPDVNYFQTQGGQFLSFGQILALAGDFYGVPSQPISDGANPQEQQHGQHRVLHMERRGCVRDAEAGCLHGRRRRRGVSEDDVAGEPDRIRRRAAAGICRFGEQQRDPGAAQYRRQHRLDPADRRGEECERAAGENAFGAEPRRIRRRGGAGRQRQQWELYTHGYEPKANRWVDYLISGTSNGNGVSAPLQTKYGLSAVSFGGDAYVVFTDKANGAPSIMTTATGT